MPRCTPTTAPSSLIDVLDVQVLISSLLLLLFFANWLAILVNFALDAEDLIYVFNDCMAVLEKLIQFNLLCRLKVCRNLARSLPAFAVVIIRVLLALLEGYADEACGGCRFLEDRLFTVILVFLKDHRLYCVVVILFFNSKGP